mgnify:FL=1|jgi:hypothetical protein
MVIDSRSPVIHLQVNWPEGIVCLILMPADEQPSRWFDPVEPVVLVWLTGLQLESNLDPSGRYWVLVVTKELPRVHFGNDPVRAGFTRFGPSSADGVERTAESILDPVVEPLAL